MSDDPHRHWYRRGYLPHFDAGATVQTVTFRLADSVPRIVLKQLAASTADKMKRFGRIEAVMDRGAGAAILRDSRCALIVENALQYFQGERYRLLAWVIMPNHVHVLIEQKQGSRLDAVVHSWKSFTAKRINAVRGKHGAVWAREYYDRYVRDAAHFENAFAYVRNNPVKAGLVARPEDWPWMGPK
jgi:putative transposase